MSTGREYLRVSLDRSGRERSQDEQHRDNERAAAERGITLGGAYRENGSASASRYATKRRDAFDRLLADLERDRFGADVLVLWESSRGSRSVGEWVRLIELAEARGVNIFVTTHGREYSPTNPRDRRSLLEDAVDSEYESAKVSMRATRAAAANAAAGKPHGAVPFGYQRTYDPRTRALVAQEPHPDEAPVVRELYRRLAAGESLRSIEREYERRGVRTRSGLPFSAQHLRNVALRASYAGLRSHDGKITGRGTWPALVDEATFYAVHVRLTDPGRVTTRPGRGVHLLSMIATCDVCGGPLAAARRDRGVYVCRTSGHVKISEAELNTLAEAVILAYLSDERRYRALVAGEGDTSEELTRVRGELAAVRAERAEAERAVPETVFEARAFAALIERLTNQVVGLETRERELTTPAPLLSIRPGKDVRRRWKAAGMPARREVARLLLVPAILGELRVRRRPEEIRRDLHVPAEQRVDFRRL
jgi:site-specific DNA recombinase